MVLSSFASPYSSWYVHMNSEFGAGGGPSVRVRMRWISFTIFSLITVKSFPFLLEAASARSCKAFSRSLVVMRPLITEEFWALKLSGYKTCGHNPYLLTRLKTISHCPPSPTGLCNNVCTSLLSSSSPAVSSICSRKKFAFSSLS